MNLDIALYPYLVAAHVTAVVFLIGSMLSLNQLLSAVSRRPQEQQIEFITSLLWLDRRITTPALLFTWIFGLLLGLSAGWFASGWLMVKLAFVVGLSALHGIQSGRLRRFIRNGQRATSIPGAGAGIVIAMVVIAILAIVKPI